MQRNLERISSEHNRLRNQRGLTIIEVLIAALIASFVIAGGMQVFVSQNKQHIIQDGVTNMQQNGRATVDELVGKIRQAGYKVPLGTVSLMSWDTNPDTVAVVFLSEPACTATLSEAMPQPSAELKCKGSNISCFQADTWAYIYDPLIDSGEFFMITQVQESAGHIQHNNGKLSKAYPAGSQIFILEFRKYYVDDTTDPEHPTFMMEANGRPAVVYADDIVDLQFRYRQGNGKIFDYVTVDRYVREVEIDVVARTHKSDLLLNEFRYDTLETAVQVRNLSM